MYVSLSSLTQYSTSWAYDSAAVMMAQYSYGGTITNQIWVFAVAFLSTFSIYKARSSIRRLRIDEHRAWVLRTWSYACTVSFSLVLERR
jgi:glycerol-3-phosphate acyltransferase PlsY